MLIVVLAEYGGGGQSTLPGEGSSSNNGTGSTSGDGNVAGILILNAPTSNTHGLPATDGAGYRIYCGTVSGTYTALIDVGNTTSIPMTTLSASVSVPGSYYITVTTYATAGNESVYSNEINQNL